MVDGRGLKDLTARLALTFERAAKAMEQSAALADLHAEREATAGRMERAAEERRIAARARAAAGQAREKARRFA